MTPLAEVARSLLCEGGLVARQWAQDTSREGVRWIFMEKPEGLSEDELALAAGLVEMMAERAGQLPPDWTASVTRQGEPIYLFDPSLFRSRRMAEEGGPEPLRRRGIYAMPNFLTWA